MFTAKLPLFLVSFTLEVKHKVVWKPRHHMLLTL